MKITEIQDLLQYLINLILVLKLDWLIEQFYYVTFWHSKVKTNTFIKYHTPVYDKKYTIKSISITVKTMTSITVKKHNFQSYVYAIHH